MQVFLEDIMKKYVILCLLFFCFPMIVFAQDTTEKMYIDIQIQEDGSIFVRELASLKGSYNGRLRDIAYRNVSAPIFTGKENDFGGSSIYNGSSITNVKVYDVKDKDNITFDSMDQLNHEFRLVSSASSGDYGVYTLVNTQTGIDLQIFNPSSYDTAFYLEYEVEDAVVVHQDVAELAWNILGDTYQENIEDLEVRVHLPQDDSSMLVWGHGPLNGNIERTTDQLATLTYDFLGAYNAIDVRMVFDPSLVPLATKQTNVVAKDKILSYEEKKAEEANQMREKIKFQNNAIKVSTIVWYLVLVGTWIFIYLKYDKEEKSNITMQYYREIPENYGPEILEYLLKKNITSDGFSASILNVIHKKALKVVSLSTKKDDYEFVKDESKMDQLTEEEKQVVSMLLVGIGNGKKVSLKDIKKFGKDYSTAKSFMSEYQSWNQSVVGKAKKEKFYQTASKPRVLGVLITIVGWLLFYLNLFFETEFILGYLVLPVSIVAFIYFLMFKKRTTKGNLQYQKWMAFKRFLLDFGRMDEKTLPEIAIWEEYLVYATVLGCAKQVEKQMQIKLQHMQEYDPSFNLADYYLMHTLIHVNMASTISNTINHAVASSRASIAQSNSSSGSGFGGGMSAGGGSFGGGGGGGRF